MKQVKLYSFEVCPFCIQAKALLGALGVEFEEQIVTRDELSDITKQTGMMTVPQIFVEDELIGGFTDLQAAVQSGEFQTKVGL